jgi:hypothetical protein
MAAATVPPTGSALTAGISSLDTAATAPYFTCGGVGVGAGVFRVSAGRDGHPDRRGSHRHSGNNRAGAYTGTFAPSPSKACNRDTGGSVALSGTTTLISTPTQVVNPAVFTELIWFKTSTGGGRLIGFGNSQTGTSTNYDRHLYLSNTGQVIFGVYNNAVFTAISPATYLDGNWHQAAATLSGAGMTLYLDGVPVATNTNTVAQNYSGYWRVGFDSLSGWGATQPSRFYFTGNLAWAAIYTTALTAAQIKNQYVAGL